MRKVTEEEQKELLGLIEREVKEFREQKKDIEKFAKDHPKLNALNMKNHV